MKPLSSTSDTFLAVPEQDAVGDHVLRLFDKAHELLASSDTIPLTTVSEDYQGQDFSAGECVEINVWALTLAINSSLVLPDQVFQIPGVIIELDATGGNEIPPVFLRSMAIHFSSLPPCLTTLGGARCASTTRAH